jgi:hypothetical protein
MDNKSSDVKVKNNNDVKENPHDIKVKFDEGVKFENDVGFLPKKYKKYFKPPNHIFYKDLGKIQTGDFLLSIKADGYRSGIFINEYGICYRIDTYDFSLYPLGKTEKYKNVILDGELMIENIFEERIKPFILVFDIIFLDNLSDILVERIKLCKDIIDSITVENVNIDYILMKKYYEKKNLSEIFTTKIKKDGIIFSSVIGRECYRWKKKPTISIGLEFDDDDDFYMFFVKKNKDGKRLKQYIHYPSFSKVFHKENGSKLFTLSKALYNIVLNKYNKMSKKKEYFIVDIFLWKDIFMNCSKSYFDFDRIRYDKKYPENIDNVKDLFRILENPITLEDIFHIKISRYFPLKMKSRRGYEWSKYVKQVKHLVYKEYVTGNVLDLCSGKGMDMNIYERLKVKNVTLVESDNYQFNFLKKRIRKYNIKTRLINNDFNSMSLFKDIGKRFKSIVCSHAIQFAMDPYETSYGIENIGKLTDINGYVIILYLNGNKLYPATISSIYSNRKTKNRLIYDIDGDLHYHIDETCKCEEDVESEKVEDIKEEKSVDLMYQHDDIIKKIDGKFTRGTHIWVKLPGSFSVTREPIVYPNELITLMKNNGFNLVKDVPYFSILKNKRFERMSNFFNVSVFQKSKFIFSKYSFLDIADDVKNYILLFLEVGDINMLRKTCKNMNNVCTKYLEKDKLGYKLLENNYEEEYYSDSNSGYYS